VLEANCSSVVNPLLDTQKVLPRSVYTENYGNYDDQKEIDLYQAMLHETDPAKQRSLMSEFEKHVIEAQAHEFPMLWWYRMIPERSYVRGWKIGPSHFINQDLSDIWLDEAAAG
jgi:peptide/nickel transport system substrate-binding protein